MENLDLFASRYLDYVGYFASIMCVISLMMKDIKKLRWLNLVSSAIFAVYAFIKNTYPVAITNIAVVLIDIYYLVVIYKEEIEEKKQEQQ